MQEQINFLFWHVERALSAVNLLCASEGAEMR